MVAHYVARIVVIISAAAVPVLASFDARTVPRPVLGLVGAMAAVAEALAQLFQFQTHALNALRTRNALERALNRYLVGADPNAKEGSFSKFAARVEDIREAADNASLDAWQKSATRAFEQGASSDKPTSMTT
jgi:hypothetical protein